MSTLLFFLTIFLLKYRVYSIPTCIIVDTNQQTEDEILPNNRSSSSVLLRNLRMLNHQRSSDFIVQSIPLSYIDVKQRSLTDSMIDQKISPCSLQSLNKLETHMVVPFEFRRLRIEQPDHQTKFLDDQQRETVPELSTAVYERRSDPEGARFCRTCQDGKQFILSSFFFFIIFQVFGLNYLHVKTFDVMRSYCELIPV
jgi:hypothetical protein